MRFDDAARRVGSRVAGPLALTAMIATGCASAAPAQAARRAPTAHHARSVPRLPQHGSVVLRLSRHGGARAVRDPFLPAASPQPPDGGAVAAPLARAARAHPEHEITVVSRLAALARAGAISQQQHHRYLSMFRRALALEHRLSSPRAAELTAVTETMHRIAARRLMTLARLPELFLTLQRNIQWWAHGPLLASGQRVEFAGSPLVWEYYAGQGIELQPLANFGKADGLYTAGPSQYSAMTGLLSALLPLAVPRAHGLAWEYLFAFDGGQPPWISGMTQGTALEALTRAYLATHDTSYLTIAHRVARVLLTAPPAGASVLAPDGRRFIQYSFAPSLDIINAFLQTLIGLFDYAQTSQDPLAEQLLAAGNAEAQHEVPSFDTGAWSLYQPGLEDDLSYHELVTGFLQSLCDKTHASVYCTTAAHFQSDLTTPPVIAQLTQRATAGRSFRLAFRLSKVSHVGIVVQSGARPALATSAQFPYGVDHVNVPRLRRGSYTVRLAATGPAGNFSRSVGRLTVRAAPRHRPRRTAAH